LAIDNPVGNGAKQQGRAERNHAVAGQLKRRVVNEQRGDNSIL
jgi:hypothetical protein